MLTTIHKIEETSPRIFEPFQDPKGQNVKKIEFKDLFITYIGTKKEIQEIIICKKETDENGNTYYNDLISNNTYYKNLNEDEIQILNEHTLLSVLSKSNINSKDVIMNNGYLTEENLITLYKVINTDLEYREKHFTYHRGPVWNDCPSFCYLHQNKYYIFEKENLEEELKKLNLTLSISEKIPVITGEKGIGKSTIRNKLNHCITENNPYMKDKEIWTIDYEDLVNETITHKHLEERINKVKNFFRRFNNRILFIDNADLDNETFLKNIIKINNKDLRIVLISNKKIEQENLDSNTFNVITINKPKEIVINAILLKKIIEESEKTNLKSNLNNEELDELLSIIIHCDDNNSLNIVNQDNNPNLGTTIIQNAYKIAIVLNATEINPSHYIEAIKQENVLMNNQNKTIAIKKLDNLDINIKTRKLKEEEKTKQKKPTFKEKIKSIFRR